MFEKKDYSKLTIEDLKLEEVNANKLNKTLTTITCVLIGICIYWAIFKTGQTFLFGLFIILAIITTIQSRKLKGIQKEINDRN